MEDNKNMDWVMERKKKKLLILKVNGQCGEMASIEALRMKPHERKLIEKNLKSNGAETT